MPVRYSSSVVAPTTRSSPRASIGFIRLPASIAPSALAGADDRVDLVDEHDDAALGLLHLAQHGLEALLELAAVLGAGDQRTHVERPEHAAAGASRARRPSAMRCASPSAIAVLPTPGSPISTGLFLVRRESTWMTRRISSSRPITGSSLPSRASAVRSRPYFSSALVLLLGVGGVDRARAAQLRAAPRAARRATRRARRAAP